jgi:uncharacterized C2H2 Zn-finger protein
VKCIIENLNFATQGGFAILCLKLLFPAQGCAFSTNARNNFLLHAYTKHEAEGNFTCCQCQQDGFRDVQILLDHLRTHRGSHLCSVDGCEFASREADAFRTHCEENHPDYDGYECHNCRTVLGGSEDYIQHIAKYKVIQFGCPYCNSDFKSKSFLIDHLNTTHPLSQRKVKMVTLTSCKLHEATESYDSDGGERILSHRTTLAPPKSAPKPTPPMATPPMPSAPPMATPPTTVAPPPTATPPVNPISAPKPAQTFSCVLCGMTFTEKSELGNHLKACKQKQESQRMMQEAPKILASQADRNVSSPVSTPGKRKVGTDFLFSFN